MATKKKSATPEVTIKTDLLQDMVTRAAKGASNDKTLPLTQMMAISLKDSVFSLATSDGTNYLYIRKDKMKGEDFYAVVPVDVFAKLISRTTSENVVLIRDENTLTVSGNGSYVLELPTEDDGEIVQYPNLLEEDDFTQAEVIAKEANLSTMKLILDTCKSALATTLDVPCYTGYYMGERVLATDTYKISAIDVKLFDEPILMSPEMMNLFEVMTAEKIEIRANNSDVYAVTADCVICGKSMEFIDDFASDKIQALVDEEFESSCKISKAGILSLLDRVSLFVGAYDQGAIRLTFDKTGLIVESKQASAKEIIPYIESNNFKPFTCTIHHEMLAQQIKSNPVDALTLYYGDDSSIKFVDGNVTQVVALLDEDEIED